MRHVITGIALALAAAVPAAAATYVTDTATFPGLGDEIGSGFDIATLNGVTGTATGSGTYLINTVDFTAGPNSVDNAPASGTFSNTATVDGTPFGYSVPYSLVIGNAFDTITIGGNTVRVGGEKVHFNTLVLSSGGPTSSGDLTATISVPEPATWAMMVAGFGLVGLGVRRRRVIAAAA